MNFKHYTLSAIITTSLFSWCCSSNAFSIKNEIVITDTTTVTSDENKHEEEINRYGLKFEKLEIKKEADNGMNISVDFSADFPTEGPQELIKEIGNNILNLISPEKTTEYSKDAVHKVFDNFIKNSTECINEEVKRDSEYDISDSEYMFQGNAHVVENTPKYITYNMETYVFMNGMHGQVRHYQLTVDKKTYKTLTCDDIILKDKIYELSDIVRNGVLTQFYTDEKPYWDGETFDFALPENAPALTKEGIGFFYNSYEIDSFAAGLPSCVIPYKDIEAIMTPEAKELIK